MSANTRNQAEGIVAGEAIGEAALIVNFYGRRAEAPAQLLHERLYRSLAPNSDASIVPDRWEDPTSETFGRRFDPPGRAAHDTTVVQVALNGPGDPADAWEIMRQKLEDILGEDDLEGTWGCTLVYQAVLKENIDADAALEAVLPAARPLHCSEELRPLAQANVSGGRIWLLAIPDPGDDLTGGTVYVALGPPGREEALLDMFYGPVATLLVPDLIAHKGYHQTRQYRAGDLEHRYEKNLEYLREVTEGLLEDLERREVQIDRLVELSSLYHRLLPVLYALEELHVGLLRQSKNYEWWRGRIEGEDVVEFHADQLRAATLELKLKAEPLQHALEMADKAVSIAQVRVDNERENLQRQIERAQEGRQRRIEAVLTAVALALALSELVTQKEVANWLRLSWLGDNAFALLGPQLLVIVTVAAIAAVLTIRVLDRWRER